MEVVCNKCGYRRNVGSSLQTLDTVFRCTECGSNDVRLVDTGGINIKIDGLTEDTIRAIVGELAKNISIADVWKFFLKKKE